MNIDLGFGGTSILFLLVSYLLGLSLSFPSSTGDMEGSETGRTHHRDSGKNNNNSTYSSGNSTKHRHKHNINSYKHVGDETDGNAFKHEVMEPPISLFENYTEGYPVDPSYADWPESDGYPWYVYDSVG